MAVTERHVNKCGLTTMTDSSQERNSLHEETIVFRVGPLNSARVEMNYHVIFIPDQGTVRMRRWDGRRTHHERYASFHVSHGNPLFA